MLLVCRARVRLMKLSACGRFVSPLRLVLCAALFVASSLFTACSPRPVVETVTTDSSRHAMLPAATPTVYASPLPAPDNDLEIAGDRIAEAAVHLNRRQSGAALRALVQARGAALRALDRRKQRNANGEALLTTLKEIESAERSIQRGALADAKLRLLDINRKLDDMN